MEPDAVSKVRAPATDAACPPPLLRAAGRRLGRLYLRRPGRLVLVALLVRRQLQGGTRPGQRAADLQHPAGRQQRVHRQVHLRDKTEARDRCRGCTAGSTGAGARPGAVHGIVQHPFPCYPSPSSKGSRRSKIKGCIKTGAASFLFPLHAPYLSQPPQHTFRGGLRQRLAAALRHHHAHNLRQANRGPRQRASRTSRQQVVAHPHHHRCQPHSTCCAAPDKARVITVPASPGSPARAAI